MYKCPECNENMRWNSDQDNGEYTWSFYTCDTCNIELNKIWDIEE